MGSRFSYFLAALITLQLAACETDGGVLGGTKEDSAVPDRDSGADKDAGKGHDSAVPDDAQVKDSATPVPPDDGGMDATIPDDGGIPFGGLVVDSTPKQQKELDLFAKAGNRFWFEVSEEQLLLINNRGQSGGGDIYSPGSGASYASHMVMQSAMDDSVADYGKVEVKLVGESTRREWSRSSIPNLHIDSDEFQTKLRVGGFEHIRFNNSQVGSIFRENLAHQVYRALGYIGLRSTYAFIGSNVWAENTWVPMTLIEVYKTKVCKDNKAVLGGDCENMWEFYGDALRGPPPENACQSHQCDNKRLDELRRAYLLAPHGPGFAKIMAPYIDWPRYHQFQCLSWIMSTGDDALHNDNNNLIIERKEDHKLIWAPYSVDISAGQDWYATTPLTGTSALAVGCQQDPQCWQATLETCETLIDKFDKLNPEKLVDQAVETLGKLDMLRSGDETRAQQVRAWYVKRQKDLAGELERYRVLPDVFGNCPKGLDACYDGTCNTTEVCQGDNSGQCGKGYIWCEQLKECVDPNYSSCPSCMDPNQKFFCPVAGACVMDEAGCTDVCKTEIGSDYVYCPKAYGCVIDGYCPVDGNEDDGGGIGWDAGGGIAGMGGPIWGGFGGFGGGGPK